MELASGPWVKLVLAARAVLRKAGWQARDHNSFQTLLLPVMLTASLAARAQVKAKHEQAKERCTNESAIAPNVPSFRSYQYGFPVIGVASMGEQAGASRGYGQR